MKPLANLVSTLLVGSISLVAGCDVPNGKALVDLDEGEWAALCDAPAETYTCEEDGTSFMVEVDCVAEVQPGCTATVGDWRACLRASHEPLREDACVLPETVSECSFWNTCDVEA